MNLNKAHPAIFLDRDGVIVVEKNFQIDPAEIEFIPRSLDGLKKLDRDFLLVVVSNQSGVARGYFTHEDVINFNMTLDRKLRQSGISISGWYFCPHGPDDNCSCRKPLPGLLLQAAEELNINLYKSWMLGDKSSDIAAGKAAGTKTILVKTGYGGREDSALEIEPDFVLADLFDSIEMINSLA